MTYKGITFNGTHNTANKLEIWCTFTTPRYWLADRLLVLCKVTNPTASEGLYATAENDSPFGMAKYELDADGYCILDFTDFYRTYRGERDIWLWYGVADYDDPSVYYLTLFESTPLGIINPERVIIPDHPLEQFGVLIEPPAKMYQNPFPTGSTTSPITFEFRETTGENWDLDEFDAAGEETDVRIVDIPSCGLAWDTDMIHITSQYGDGVSYRMDPRNCESKYAVVRWVSFTGATRVHVFELHKVKQTTANAYDLLNLAGEYTEIKGREDSFILSLDGLSAYDLWYYADILQSSKVEVQVEGDQPFRRVKITDNSITIPDGNGGTNKLEINVKWQNYDAIIV